MLFLMQLRRLLAHIKLDAHQDPQESFLSISFPARQPTACTGACTGYSSPSAELCISHCWAASGLLSANFSSLLRYLWMYIHLVYQFFHYFYRSLLVMFNKLVMFSRESLFQVNCNRNEICVIPFNTGESSNLEMFFSFSCSSALSCSHQCQTYSRKVTSSNAIENNFLTNTWQHSVIKRLQMPSWRRTRKFANCLVLK